MILKEMIGIIMVIITTNNDNKSDYNNDNFNIHGDDNN